MPHDSKGRLIEVGDTIRAKAINNGREFAGVVVEVNAGSTCSGQFRFIDYGGVFDDYFDAEDSTVILKGGVSPE